MRPFIARYAVAPDRNPIPSLYNYDPEQEISVSRGEPVIGDRAQAMALTGSLVTLADRDPTRDEATDR